MNKINKVTLPTIGLSNRRAQQKDTPKIQKGWMINDTFSNWRKRNNKNSPPLNYPQVVADISEKQEALSKAQISSGITLGEYFRTRANTEHSYAEDIQDFAEEQILPYLQQNFQIHETDEDNYDESETSIRVSQKKRKEKSQLKTEKQYTIKMKTQSDQQPSPYITSQSLKKKLLTSNRSKQKIQQMHQMEQSFSVKHKNKSRILSNQTSKKLKAADNLRKITVLERAKADKFRASELRSANADLMTKYAKKFHIDQKSRLEIMRCGN